MRGMIVYLKLLACLQYQQQQALDMCDACLASKHMCLNIPFSCVTRSTFWILQELGSALGSIFGGKF
jgi:hypothetical protein